MNRAITLSLDEQVLEKVRVLAAKRGTSVSAMLRDELRRLASEDDAFRAAREEARARLARPAHLGGAPLGPRDELHDRGALR